DRVSWALPFAEADEAEGGASAEGSDGCDLRPQTFAGQELLRLLPRQQPRLSEARLSGVDSLAVLTLCRQLRLAVPGLRLRPQDVFQCDTLGELLTLVEGCPLDAADDLPAPSYGPGESRAVWFTPGQVNNTCKWLYGCKGLLDEGCFRRACARLLGRHEGLRAELGPVGMEMLRFLRDVPALHAPLWPQLEPRARKLGLARPLRACKELCAWGLKHSWPRSHPRPVTRQFLEERVLVVRCKSWRDLELAYSRLREEWRSPVAIALFLLERGREEKSMSTWERPEDWRGPTSFLQFIVSHAWSDGFCGVPLVQDFSALYVQEEAAAGKGSGVCQASLLPLPNGAAFQALESRLFAALDCQPGWSHPDQMSLRSAIFDETPKWTPWVYNHEVLLEASAVAGLRSCAGRRPSSGVGERSAVVSPRASIFLTLAFPAMALQPFGDQTPGCEPYWYQGYHSAYYGPSHVAFRKKCRDFVEEEVRPYLEGWISGGVSYPLELHGKALARGLPTAGLQKDVQRRYPAEVLPEGGLDALHELIYLDELAAVGPGG
ncbi:unnamed protein product, partial [Effrenium voratum]